jgi:hypothetical protein
VMSTPTGAGRTNKLQNGDEVEAEFTEEELVFLVVLERSNGGEELVDPRCPRRRQRRTGDGPHREAGGDKKGRCDRYQQRSSAGLDVFKTRQELTDEWRQGALRSRGHGTRHGEETHYKSLNRVRCQLARFCTNHDLFPSQRRRSSSTVLREKWPSRPRVLGWR